MLCVAITTATAMTLSARAIMANGLLRFLPRKTPTSPTMPTTAPISAKMNDPLLMIGIKDVSTAIAPSTTPIIAATDNGFCSE